MNRLLAYALLAAALATAGLLWYNSEISAAEERGATAQRVVDQKAAEALKTEAAKLLQQETDKTAAVEKSLREFKTNQEIKDVEAVKYAGKQSARIASLVNANGQLRDPFGAGGCGQSSGGAQAQAGAGPSSGGDDPTQAQGLLSAKFSGFIRDKLAEADEINTAYASCRADLFNRIAQGE